MFDKPIKYVKIESMEEVKKFSCIVSWENKQAKMYCQEAGHIFFVDETGTMYVTPYRNDVKNVLKKEGYTEDSYFQFSIPTFKEIGIYDERYQWLKKFAEEDDWNEAYQMCKNFCHDRIKPVYCDEDDEIVKIYDISSMDNGLSDTISGFCFMSMFNYKKADFKNVGTYIIVNEKTLVVCDEYGRTFVIIVKERVNNLVNKLIDSNYQRNSNPQEYVIK